MGGNPNLFFVAKWQRFAANFFVIFNLLKKIKEKKTACVVYTFIL
jgi:hypothetical protein